MTYQRHNFPRKFSKENILCDECGRLYPFSPCDYCSIKFMRFIEPSEILGWYWLNDIGDCVETEDIDNAHLHYKDTPCYAGCA